MSGPFYFAWVGAHETTFNSVTHKRQDESIYSFTVEHNEGDFATLNLEIRNPRIGLLAPARKIHCWLSWDNGHDVVPLFHGRLVGVPNDINLEVVTLQFTARADNHIGQKAALAQSLRVAPYYDPMWVSQQKRSDPDTVLEARSELWHIDRVSNVVTTSDLLVGEDADEEFLASDVLYDNVSVHLNQTPLRTVFVNADVAWTQQAFGTLAFPKQILVSFGAEKIASSWPKPGSGLGGGWEVVSSNATTDIDNFPDDAFKTEIEQKAPPAPLDDDVEVVPVTPAPPPPAKIGQAIPDGWTFIKTSYEMQGKSGAQATLRVKETGVVIPVVTAYCTMSVTYHANRARKEALSFALSANVQPLITLPGQDDVLDLNVSGGDVGHPVLVGSMSTNSIPNPHYFNDVGGGDPDTQMSDRRGLVTVTSNHAPTDGTIDQLVDGDIADDSGSFHLPNGLTDLAITFDFNPDGDQQIITAFLWQQSAAGSQGSYVFEASQDGVNWHVLARNLNLGATENSEFVVSNATAYWYYRLRQISGATTNAVLVREIYFKALARAAGSFLTGQGVPAGNIGVDGDYYENTLNETLYRKSGSTWSVVGSALSSPLLPIGNVSRRSFFPTARGIESIEYLIMLARAHLILRSRAVEISWDCRFERAVNLSCRKNALIHDSRLPGGQGFGKVIKYSFSANGDTGEVIGHVTIGCAIGFGDAVATSAGEPTYVDAGYVNDYQFYDGTIVAVGTGDVGYSIPVDRPNDDGLVFPLTQIPFLQQPSFTHAQVGADSISITYSGDASADATNNKTAIENYLKTLKPRFSFSIRPVEGGSFESEYDIYTTDLVIPQGINLYAPSSG